MAATLKTTKRDYLFLATLMLMAWPVADTLLKNFVLGEGEWFAVSRFGLTNFVLVTLGLSAARLALLVLRARRERILASMLKGMGKSLLRDLTSPVRLLAALLPRRVINPTEVSPASVADRAANIFNVVSAVVPQKLANEELGDALEDVRRRVRENRPRSEIELKIWSSVFWVGVHTLGDLARQVVAIAKGL